MGIRLPGMQKTLKVAQLADDLTLFIKGSNDVIKALAIIDLFSEFSGLKLNYNKCEGLWVGPKPPTGLPDIIKWCKEGAKLKILGVYFSCNESASEIADNWEPKLKVVLDTIKHWEKRNLSIMGKI